MHSTEMLLLMFCAELAATALALALAFLGRGAPDRAGRGGDAAPPPADDAQARDERPDRLTPVRFARS